MTSLEDARVYVAGHRGLVGSALLRALKRRGLGPALVRTRAELDLRDASRVLDFFARERPEVVFLAAAKVGGIHANATYPVDFLRDNLLIQTHVFDAALRTGVRKLVFLGSSCIYPRLAPQPIPESALLTGALEPTNEAYAIAKLAGVAMVRAYRQQHGLSAIALMPTNLYGPHDDFDLESSHVLPALIRKFVEAKDLGHPSVELWGSGTPRREFLHVDDLADACLFLAERYDSPEPINVGCGQDVSILELAELIRSIAGYGGSLRWDASRPDGTPRKLLDVSRLRGLGWSPRISLEEGVRSTVDWFRRQRGASR